MEIKFSDKLNGIIKNKKSNKMEEDDMNMLEEYGYASVQGSRY